LANSSRLIGGLVVFPFTLLFILPWWNRYLGITNEGWYQFFGKQILQGRMPYRDFYLFVPPGQSLVMAALTSVFGDRIIVPELFGFVVAIVLALTLYVWMSRLFPALWAALATICATAIYLKGPSESLSGLQLSSNLYPILALCAASFALDKKSGSRSLLLAGVFAGLSFVMKQTAGVAALSIGIILPALIAFRSPARAGLRVAAFFAIGWSAPVLLTVGWLGTNGAFGAFLNDVFLQGPASKGSLVSLLARQVYGISSSLYQEVATAAALVVVVGAGLLFRLRVAPDGENRNLSKRREGFAILGFGAIALALIIYAQHWPNALPSRLHRLDFFFSIIPIYVGEFGSLALLMVYGWRLLRRKLSEHEEQLLLAASVSFVCAFLTSFSWATGRTMLVPAFPFVAAFGLARLPSGKVFSLAKISAVLVALLCVAVMAGSKTRVPYYWADWREGDALRASATLDFPELCGIKVTPETAAFLRRVVGDIQQYSRPNDPIAEFSTMPILYTLAHRTPMTFAYIHYIDVTPDYVYRIDARKLEKDPPAVIVFLRRSEAEFKEDELNFRNGRRSAERELWETIRTLGCKYRIVDLLQTPNTNQTFEVWARESGHEQPCTGSKIDGQ
jgi:hypothetical protein